MLARIAGDETVPDLARDVFADLGREFAGLQARIRQIEARLMAWHRRDERSRRLTAIPGVGPVGAAMLSLKAPDPHLFASGRQFAAWMGLTPRDHSTAGRTRLGVITRAGDTALRAVLVAGATSAIQQARRGRGWRSPWLVDLLGTKEPKEAAVALANKTARIAWKLMVSGETYDPHRTNPAPAQVA